MSQGRSTQASGVIAMVVSSGLLTANDAISKHLAESISVGQIIFFRQLGVVILLLTFVGAAGQLPQFRIVNGRGQILRGLLFVASMFVIVQALSLLPLPVVSVGLFTSPLVTALLSGLLLSEIVGVRRWAAALLGFAGVLIIVRPAGTDFTWLSLLPFIPALTIGLYDIVTRRLTQTDSPLSILMWSNVIIVLAAIVLLLVGPVSRPVSPEAAAWLVLNAILNLGAHFFMIQALKLADASLVAPFKYTGLIWAFVIAFLWWGYAPDVWTLAGSVLIVLSGLYALRPGAPARKH